jgi:nitrogen regulatory protein P-II 2
MKYIVAVIQPDRLHEVLDELDKKQIHLATVTQAMGRGRQKGVAEVYRAHKEVGSLLRKVKVEVAVNDEFVEAAIDAITIGARSGNIGDGKIFVYDLSSCVRIRTGESGMDAIG